MSPAPRFPGDRKSRRLIVPGTFGCLACLGSWLAALWAPQIIGRNFGWQYAGAYYLVLLLILALSQAVRIHRRGQTVLEAWTASRAERRLRRERVQRARRDAVVLPWLADQQLDPAASGVLITPAPSVPAYSRVGYDVVLDSAGAHKIPVIKEVRTLTRFSLKDAKDLVESAPVTLLRAPDRSMAEAAKSVLEAVGAAVSITDLAGQLP
jgi:large subunit ribosomal protein L7/L12